MALDCDNPWEHRWCIVRRSCNDLEHTPEARTLLCGSQNLCKFVGRANPITNFEFVEEYVKNNKPNKYLIFIFLAYPIPNLDYVSHTRFNCVVIAKPFRYLNYEEDYVSTAYLTTYLDFVVATQSMSSQWGNKCGHYKI